MVQNKTDDWMDSMHKCIALHSLKTNRIAELSQLNVIDMSVVVKEWDGQWVGGVTSKI